MGDQGFDEMVNDGIFDASRRFGVQAAPDLWPKSVSEMRRHTNHTEQGMSRNSAWETGHSQRLARGFSEQPRFYQPFWHDISHPRNQGTWVGPGPRPRTWYRW